MRRIVSVWLIDWPVTVWRRSATRARRPASPPDPALDPQTPFALVLKNSRGAAILHALNPAARRAGLRRGQTQADARAMQALLAQRPGVTLVCAGTATEGLALAADADLVLLDLDLPDHPGIEVLRVLKADARWRALPVIVVSAETRPQRIDDCFDAGANQFLTKPLDGQQVLRAIDDALSA